MAPELWELMEAGPGDDDVRAILRLRRPNVVPPGVRVVAQFGDVATCRLRRDRILEVRRHPAVRSLKAPEIITPDPSGPAPRAEDATGEGARPSDRRRPPGLGATGRGVVVAAADWGCDVGHPAFRQPDGRTRLAALWDQSAPYDGANRYGYGAVHERAAIDVALASADPYAALGLHPGRADRAGTGAHGTHVLDIAAGNGRGGGPVGLAPQAELVFVHLDTGGMSRLATLGDSVTVLEAVDFVARAAGNRPWVLNASLGTHGGPHDGRTLCEMGLDRALDEAPGRAVVQSCGNYYRQGAHASGQLRPGQRRTLRFVVDAADVTPNEVEVWYPGRDAFAVTLRGPDGVRVGPVRLGERAEVRVGGRLAGRLYHRTRDPNNHDQHVNLFLYPQAPAGRWAITLDGEDVVDGRYHAWIERDATCPGCQSRFVGPDVDPGFTTNSICNGLRTIGVGAYDAHDPARPLGPFSSQGPTRDGRTKPDLLAPGVGVLAARSAAPGVRVSEALPTRKSGTSMAAPHVTGAVALMFEAAARPLAIAETRRTLLGSATPAPPGLSPWRVGSGYLDVESAIKAAGRLTDNSPHDPEDAMSPDDFYADDTHPDDDLDAGDGGAWGSDEAAWDALDEGDTQRLPPPGALPPPTPHRSAQGALAVPLTSEGDVFPLAERSGGGESGGSAAREQQAQAVPRDAAALVVRPTPAGAAETVRSLGTVTVHGVAVEIGVGGAAPVHIAVALDDALRAALTRTESGLAITGDPFGGGPYKVYAWEGPLGPIRLPSAVTHTPPVTNLTTFPGVAALLIHGLPYVATDPGGALGPWVPLPRLRDRYALPQADLDRQRGRWAERLARAGALHPTTGAALDRAALDALPVPALHVLLVRHREQAVPVKLKRRRGRDAGGVANGVTWPVTTYPVSEPQCYLPVIARKEGALESINAWDQKAGISIGPVQINAQRGAIFRVLWRLWEEDRPLFQSAFGAFGWTMRWHDGHPDLIVQVEGADPQTLHGRARASDVDDAVEYFERGRVGAPTRDPNFRRRLAGAFRDVLVYPHVQEWVVETAAWWLGAGLRMLHREGLSALDPAQSNGDVFRLKALLLSIYVRFSGYARPVLRQLQSYATTAEKLAHVEDGIRGYFQGRIEQTDRALAAAPDPALATTDDERERLRKEKERLKSKRETFEEHRDGLVRRIGQQRGHADAVFATIERLRRAAEARAQPASDAWADADAQLGADAWTDTAASGDGAWTDGDDLDPDWDGGDHGPAALPTWARAPGEALADQADAAVAVASSHLLHDVARRALAPRLARGTRGLSAQAVFDALAGVEVSDAVEARFERLAGPGDRLDPSALRPGDLLVRLPLGEGGGHVAVLADGATCDPAEAARRGLVSESRRPGVYAQVIEGGAVPHRRADRFARRLAGPDGRLPRGHVVARFRSGVRPVPEAALAENDLAVGFYLPEGGRAHVPAADATLFRCAPAPLAVTPASRLPVQTTDPAAALRTAMAALGHDAAAVARFERRGGTSVHPIAAFFGAPALTELLRRLRYPAGRLLNPFHNHGDCLNSLLGTRHAAPLLAPRLLLAVPGHFRELARRAPTPTEAHALESLGWVIMDRLRRRIALTGVDWWTPPAPDWVATTLVDPLPSLSDEVRSLVSQAGLAHGTPGYLPRPFPTGTPAALADPVYRARFEAWDTGLPGQIWRLETGVGAHALGPAPGLPYYPGLVTVPAVGADRARQRTLQDDAWRARLAATDARFGSGESADKTLFLHRCANADLARFAAARGVPGAGRRVDLGGMAFAYHFPTLRASPSLYRNVRFLDAVHPVAQAAFTTLARLGWNDLVFQCSGGFCFRGVKRGRGHAQFHSAARRLSDHGRGEAVDLNVVENPQGNAHSTMSPRVVALFEAFGFRWGRCFRTPDPHHFEVD